MKDKNKVKIQIANEFLIEMYKNGGYMQISSQAELLERSAKLLRALSSIYEKNVSQELLDEVIISENESEQETVEEK